MLLVGKAATILERNREMYDMVNQELMAVRSLFPSLPFPSLLPSAQAVAGCVGVWYQRTLNDASLGGWPSHTAWQRPISGGDRLVIRSARSVCTFLRLLPPVLMHERISLPVRLCQF